MWTEHAAPAGHAYSRYWVWSDADTTADVRVCQLTHGVYHAYVNGVMVKAVNNLPMAKVAAKKASAK